MLLVCLPLPICGAHGICKDTQVSEKTEFRRSYHRSVITKSEIRSVIDPILSYKGTSGQPQWTDEDAGAPVQLLT